MPRFRYAATFSDGDGDGVDVRGFLRRAGSGRAGRGLRRRTRRRGNVGGISAVTGLSCASVGSCEMVGYYYAGLDDQQPFVGRGAIAVPTSAALTLSAAAVV
jgi:hypothetical protein